jgi:putative hydrolase of the HAD superfamily
MIAHAACVVFDLDDTLYLEADYARSGFAAVGEWTSANLGIPDFAAHAWRVHEEGARGDVFNRALAAAGIKVDPELILRLVDVYRRHRPQIALLPDAAECLRELHGKVFLGLITDGPALSQRAKVEALQLSSLMDEVIITDDLGRTYWKPHPRAFEAMQQLANVSSEDCYYIGDNPDKDFIAARQLGWNTVRVRRKDGLHCSKANAPETCAQREVSDLRSLPSLVLRQD